MIGPWELLVVLIVSCIVFGIPIVLAVVFFRMMVRNKNENIRLRLEVGKLADELEKARKQKGSEGGESKDES
ncbi:MAG: LapA family protein [Planctomycetota bacterium]|jgi:hypothetical protein